MTRLHDLRVFLRTMVAASAALVALHGGVAAAATVTLSDDTNPGDRLECPRADGSPRTPFAVDTFQLSADADARVTRVQVRLSPADAYLNVERVEIRPIGADSSTTPLASVIPSAELFWVSLATPIDVTTSPATYKIEIVPKEHRYMPPPSIGKEIAIQARMQAMVSAGNTVTGSDAASSTITIDNGSPANVLWEGLTSAGGTITLDWAGTPNPYVLVLRREIGPVENLPLEGATYTASTTYGTSRVVFAATGASYPDAGLVTRPYYYRVFTRDSCNNYSAGTPLGPIYPDGTGEGDASPNSLKPVVGILNPGPGPASNPFRVQIRVFSPEQQAIARVRLYGNSGAGDQVLADSDAAFAGPKLVRNTNYDDPGNAYSAIYEVTGGLTVGATGTWTLRAWAQNASGFVYSGGVGVIVGGTKGDGRLLVRDNSDQLCADCHKMKSHSSEAVGMQWGSWYVGCRACHDAHGSTNAKLIADQITPPSVSGAIPPARVYYAGGQGYSATGGAADPGASSYANKDGTGPCQVCHTRLTSGTDGGGNPIPSVFNRGAVTTEGELKIADHTGGRACASCHSHEEGQAPTCTSCHGDKTRPAGAGADPMQAAAPPKSADPVNPTTDPSRKEVGRHTAHVNQGRIRAALACGDCHPYPNQHAATPAPGAADLAFGPVASGTVVTAPDRNDIAATNIPGAQYNVVSATNASCANYCHGGFGFKDPDTGIVDAGYGKPSNIVSWTAGAALDCNSCHGRGVGVAATAPGGAHVDDNRCGNCHAGYGVDGLTVNAATHLNGKAIAGVDYTPQAALATCTGCHGNVDRVTVYTVADPLTGAALGKASPPKDTRGSSVTGTSVFIGAHEAHVNQVDSPALMRPIGCVECHGNVSGYSQNPSGNHQNGLPNVAFQGANAAATYVPAAAPSTQGSCVSTYCHGNNTVSWGTGTLSKLACNACHGNPPAEPHVQNPNCGTSGCHAGYGATAPVTTVNVATHVNETVDVDTGSQTCSTCHGTTGRNTLLAGALGPTDARLAAAPPMDTAGLSSSNRVGPHLAHVYPNPAQAQGQIYLAFGCVECHTSAVTTYTNTHPNTTRNVSFANATAANRGGYTPTPIPGSPYGCTTYCHGDSLAANQKGTVSGGTGWKWDGTTAACNSCHGGAPNDPEHSSVSKSAASTVCNACHNTTVDATGKIIFSGSGASATTLHINGAFNTDRKSVV